MKLKFINDAKGFSYYIIMPINRFRDVKLCLNSSSKIEILIFCMNCNLKNFY